MFGAGTVWAIGADGRGDEDARLAVRERIVGAAEGGEEAAPVERRADYVVLDRGRACIGVEESTDLVTRVDQVPRAPDGMDVVGRHGIEIGVIVGVGVSDTHRYQRQEHGRD
jgi:hypothetical protein